MEEFYGQDKAKVKCPAMNLIDGALENGVFRAENIVIAGLPQQHSIRVTLGFRAEDVALSDDQDQISV
ncbi:hypothetical protein AB833_10090 [Chromatiales bacterium (ex Bugula neritina AB1)]|nr:hypothetical protein AB833_10090 [Chromatiales bacterium (ex Bugula neritina AB1)]